MKLFYYVAVVLWHFRTIVLWYCGNVLQYCGTLAKSFYSAVVLCQCPSVAFGTASISYISIVELCQFSNIVIWYNGNVLL